MGGAQVAEHFGFNLLWWILSGLAVITALGFLRLHIYTAKKEPVFIEKDDLSANAGLLAASEEPIL